MANLSAKMLYIARIITGIILLAVIVVAFYNAFRLGLLKDQPTNTYDDKMAIAEASKPIYITLSICGIIGSLSLASFVVSENARPAIEWDSQSCRSYLIALIVLGSLLVFFYAIGGIFGIIHLNERKEIEKLMR